MGEHDGVSWASVDVAQRRDTVPDPTQVWTLKHHRLGLVKLQSAAVEPEETTGKMLKTSRVSDSH